MLLEHRCALVTGGGGDLGRAICKAFAREGAAVAVNDLDAEAAATTAKECQELGVDARAIAADVSDSDAVGRMFDEVARWWERLDVLVNNAGISASADKLPAPATSTWERGLTQITDENWRRMLAVHLDGTFFCTRAAFPRMVDAGTGSIICMSSIAGSTGWGPIHYSAAKGGILGFVRSLARVAGPLGIRVNAVCPGAIDAGMTKVHPREMMEAVLPQIPLRRLGLAEDIADTALYLASDLSSYLTGATISPNGGLSIA
jgi:3-oxoacyl-[acyl-carrier protein] reductase